MDKILASAMTIIFIVFYTSVFAADSCPDSETIVQKYLQAKKVKGPVILPDGKIDRDRWLELSSFKKDQLLIENDIYLDSNFIQNTVVGKLTENPPGSVAEMKTLAAAEQARLSPFSYAGDFDQKKWDALTLNEKSGIILSQDPALNADEIAKILSRMKSNPPLKIETFRSYIQNEIRPRNQSLFRSQGAESSVSRTKWSAFSGVDAVFVNDTEEYLNLFRNIDFSSRNGVIVGKSSHVKSMLTTYIKGMDTHIAKLRDDLAKPKPDSNKETLLREEIEISEKFRSQLINYGTIPELLTHGKFFDTSKYAVLILGKREEFKSPRHIRVEYLRRELNALEKNSGEAQSFTSINIGVQIPTNRALTIEEMNLLSDKGVSFVGVTLRPVTVDGARLDPEAFFEHDIFHGENQFLIDPKFGFLEKFFRNSPPDQTKIRHLLWFYFWHERPMNVAITPENFAEFSRQLQNGNSPMMKFFLQTLKNPDYFGSEEAIRRINTADVRKVARDMTKDLSE